ncbi:MAG: AI-2E family transporter [Deltaproteobacteria bacterium]|jgi:AI-2 transport protein TqsA|nr:AI-2E family transporter [Deltaproteobacteria bacterium]MBW2415017.1 AI-2E family transporter [Deltaproteobacteria bacterium]
MDSAALEQRVQTICLLVLATVATAFALYWLRPVMLPFVMALFVAFGLQPLVALQVRRLRLPRGLAIAATGVLGLILLWLIGGLLTTSIGQLAANSQSYQAQIGSLIARLGDALQEVGLDLPDEIAGAGISGRMVRDTLLSTTNAILELLSQSLLVTIFVIFLLIGGSAEPGPAVWRAIEVQVQRYLLTKAVLSSVTGVLVGLTLTVLGVDLALVFGLFAFLLNFIPSIGSVIATLLPLPVVLFSPEVSATTAVLAIAIPGGLQFLIGSVLEPKIMGDSLDLHPIAILIALIFWGMLWGVIGMLLAAPITAVMKILFERLEMTQPLARLLSGRLAAPDAPPPQESA